MDCLRTEHVHSMTYLIQKTQNNPDLEKKRQVETGFGYKQFGYNIISNNFGI
jgi:hypothetical protein